MPDILGLGWPPFLDVSSPEGTAAHKTPPRDGHDSVEVKSTGAVAKSLLSFFEPQLPYLLEG